MWNGQCTVAPLAATSQMVALRCMATAAHMTTTSLTTHANQPTKLRMSSSNTSSNGWDPMPKSLVKTPQDERLWRAAKAAAAKQGRADDHAYIMGVFKRMKAHHGGGRADKK